MIQVPNTKKEQINHDMTIWYHYARPLKISVEGKNQNQVGLPVYTSCIWTSYLGETLLGDPSKAE